MSLDQVRQAVYNKLSSSGFGASFPNVPIELPNQPFLTPNDKVYIKLSIIHGESNPVQITKTKQIDRYVGIVQFDVIAPLDSGTKIMNDVGDFLGKIYRRQEIKTPTAGTLVFRTPNILVVGQERGAERLVIRIPFRRDEYFNG